MSGYIIESEFGIVSTSININLSSNKISMDIITINYEV